MTAILISILSLSVLINFILLNKYSQSKKLKIVYNQRIKNLSELESEAETIVEREKAKTIEHKKKILDQYNSRLTKLRNVVYGSVRKGFYEHPLVFTDENDLKHNFIAYVYVDEIDRYTNGKSKIKIDYIEADLPLGNTLESVRKFLDRTFVSLKDTKEITWLESVDELSKERSKKLERILKDDK